MWVADMDFRTAPAIVNAYADGWNTVSRIRVPQYYELLQIGSHAVTVGRLTAHG
mgnify:CR=1 FL=1